MLEAYFERLIDSTYLALVLSYIKCAFIYQGPDQRGGPDMRGHGGPPIMHDRGPGGPNHRDFHGPLDGPPPHGRGMPPHDRGMLSNIIDDKFLINAGYIILPLQPYIYRAKWL